MDITTRHTFQVINERERISLRNAIVSTGVDHVGSPGFDYDEQDNTVYVWCTHEQCDAIKERWQRLLRS